MDIKDFKLYDAELNSGNEKRDYRLDILLVSDLVDLVISIEMNQFPSEETKYKDRLYVYALLAKSLNSGEDIKKKKVIQINFNKEKHPYVSKGSFYLMDKVTNREIKDFEIYEVYLENYKGIRYNGDNKEEAYLSLFTANSYEELREIAGDDKEALKIVDELERLGLNEKFSIVYDNEVMQKKNQKGYTPIKDILVETFMSSIILSISSLVKFFSVLEVVVSLLAVASLFPEELVLSFALTR